MPRVIVLDPLSKEGLDLLQSAGNIEVDVRTGLKGKELHDALLEYDGAICRSGVKITAEALEGNRRLRAIARAGVGVDNIDIDAATRQGIVVMNTPGGNTITTAEHAISMMLAMARNIPWPCRGTFFRPTRASSKDAGTASSSPARNWPARLWASSAWGGSGRRWPSGPRPWK